MECWIFQLTKNIKHQNFDLTDIQIVVLKTFPDILFPISLLKTLCGMNSFN